MQMTAMTTFPLKSLAATGKQTTMKTFPLSHWVQHTNDDNDDISTLVAGCCTQTMTKKTFPLSRCHLAILPALSRLHLRLGQHPHLRQLRLLPAPRESD